MAKPAKQRFWSSIAKQKEPDQGEIHVHFRENPCFGRHWGWIEFPAVVSVSTAAFCSAANWTQPTSIYTASGGKMQPILWKRFLSSSAKTKRPTANIAPNGSFWKFTTRWPRPSPAGKRTKPGSSPPPANSQVAHPWDEAYGEEPEELWVEKGVGNRRKFRAASLLPIPHSPANACAQKGKT